MSAARLRCWRSWFRPFAFGADAWSQSDAMPASSFSRRRLNRSQRQAPPPPQRSPGLSEIVRPLDGRIHRQHEQESWRNAGGARRATAATPPKRPTRRPPISPRARPMPPRVRPMRSASLAPARIATGRERCAIAANGAPDCRLAAETLCKSKGFASRQQHRLRNRRTLLRRRCCSAAARSPANARSSTS